MRLRDTQISSARRGLEYGAQDFLLGKSDAVPEHEASRAGYYKPQEIKAFVTGYNAARCKEWQEDYKEGKRDLLAKAIDAGVFTYPGYVALNLY